MLIDGAQSYPSLTKEFGLALFWFLNYSKILVAWKAEEDFQTPQKPGFQVGTFQMIELNLFLLFHLEQSWLLLIMCLLKILMLMMAPLFRKRST